MQTTSPLQFPDNEVFIVAELGINFNGDVEIAKKLIKLAHDAGCNAVKFQKRTIDAVYNEATLSTPRESPWGTTTREQKEGLELNEAEYDIIDAYCKELGIIWFASAWDKGSVDFLKKYDLPLNKIASAMITNTDFLEYVAAEKKMTLISTGMCTFDVIDEAVRIFAKHNCPFVLMHTVSTYPCHVSDCNISMVKTLKNRYLAPIGYSGHEVGVLPSVLAVAMGAVVIERHITLDRSMYGSDQAASLEKHGLELLVRDCHQVSAAMGNGIKTFSDAEKSVAKKLRYFEN